MSVNYFRLIRDSYLDRSPKAGEKAVLKCMQIAADGRLCPQIAELYASTRLIAIEKPAKTGKPPGIRPIAIGAILRRAAATMVLKFARRESRWIPVATEILAGLRIWHGILHPRLLLRASGARLEPRQGATLSRCKECV